MDARDFLGLQPTHNPHRWHFPVTPGLSTSGGFLFGGCGLAAAITALEGTTGRPLVWATAQYLSYATPGSVVDIDVTIAVSGRNSTQARAVGHVADREIFTVNAALGARDLAIDEAYVRPIDVPAPDACDPRPLRIPGEESIMSRIDLRLASAKAWEDLVGSPAPGGRSALWARIPNILDTSAVQDRAAPGMTMHQLLPSRGYKHWHDGLISQHSIYVTYGGRPFLFNVDEFGSGGVKLFDATDFGDLRLRTTIKLAINLPENLDRWAASASSSGAFGYESHYCSVDRREDPRALACGWAQSGVRVFDVRDPDRIREIAYYNPPAQTGKNDQLPNSQHVRFGGIVVPPASSAISIAQAILNGQINGDDIVRDGRIIGLDLSADWCMSPPEFRGNLLYVTCSDNGLMTLRIDPAVYPPR